MSPPPDAPWRARWHVLKAALFSAFPHAWVSATAGWLARLEHPAAKDLLIRLFLWKYALRMDEAEVEDPAAYPTLDALFTRPLKPEARPWPERPDALAAPCDGRLSRFGRLEDGRLIQAKGQTFTAGELLADAGDGARFAGGAYATFYLAPQDCHRVYMPAAGRLLAMRRIPGRQHSVAPWAAQQIPRLYARNERVACLFEGGDGAAFAVVMVGALNVAAIEIAWHGLVAPAGRAVARWDYRERAPVRLARGDELGRFHLGSTVVLLHAAGDWRWDGAVAVEKAVRCGQALAVPGAGAVESEIASDGVGTAS